MTESEREALVNETLDKVEAELRKRIRPALGFDYNDGLDEAISALDLLRPVPEAAPEPPSIMGITVRLDPTMPVDEIRLEKPAPPATAPSHLRASGSDSAQPATAPRWTKALDALRRQVAHRLRDAYDHGRSRASSPAVLELITNETMLDIDRYADLLSRQDTPTREWQHEAWCGPGLLRGPMSKPVRRWRRLSKS